ncbi:hypothetical protein SUGI_0596150 [Cryptomeria japonica]|nr:hypothetical protein SUGI_0596150 [Cryptomeria japonica]
MGSTEQNIREEILSMFEEYDMLPQLIQRELPFSGFMDFHPRQHFKTDFAKKQYHMIALTLFSQEEERKTSSEVCESLHDEFEKHADVAHEASTNENADFDDHKFPTHEGSSNKQVSHTDLEFSKSATIDKSQDDSYDMHATTIDKSAERRRKISS